MEKPYRIEDEKDLADTRYRWQYRAGIMYKSPRILIYKGFRTSFFVSDNHMTIILNRYWNESSAFANENPGGDRL